MSRSEMYDVFGIQKGVMNINHHDLSELLDDDHTQYPLLSSGSGNPGSTPSRVGLIYIDTTNDIVYISTATSSSADWKEAAALAMTAAQRDAISSPATGLEVYNTDRQSSDAYDSQRWRGLSRAGWCPMALPLGFAPLAAFTAAQQLAANGGSLAIAISVPAQMLLQSVTVRNTNTTLSRTWGWDLYEQYLNNGNSGENTLTRVAASTADETFTAAAASNRTINAATLPTYLRPGLYWLVIQCRHASNSFDVGGTALPSAFAPNQWQLKTTTNPNGATLDFVAATWTKATPNVAVRLNGRVFGQTAAF